MITPYASELGDDEGIPSGVFVTTPARVVKILAKLDQRDLLDFVRGIAMAYDVSLEGLLGKCRTRRLIEARHRTWQELYATGHWSYPRIANLFDVEWSTVRHAIHKGWGGAKESA